MELQLAESIRTLRKERAMTQEQLAEALGVTPGAVHKWEAGLSVPELRLVVEMADFFGISVDALLGYSIRDNSLAAIGERLNACLRSGDPAALAEAEQALRRYPNSFDVVNGCAQVYHVFGSEGHNREYLRRALELYGKALLLIPQNAGTYVSEQTISGNIGSIHILMGETEKGLEVLKKHNAGGMFSGDIGDTLAMLLHRPEEAAPFLSEALLNTAADLWDAVLGFAFAFGEQGDFTAEREIVGWGIGTLRGLRKPGPAGFLNKAIAILLILQAHALLHGGEPEAARSSVMEAAALARRFDARPDYGLTGLRFAKEMKDGSVHDSLGGMAGESAAFLLEQLRDPALASLWEEALAACPEVVEESKEEEA